MARSIMLLLMTFTLLSPGCATTASSRPEPSRTWSRTVDRVASFPETVVESMTPSDRWLSEHPVADTSLQVAKFVPLTALVIVGFFLGMGPGIPSSSN